MEAFSFPHYSFLIDSVFLPNAPIKISGFMNEANKNTDSSPQICPSNTFYEVPVDQRNHESTYLDYSPKVVLSDNELSVTKKQSTESSTVFDKLESGEQVAQKVIPMDKKRKNRNGQSKDPKKSKPKKQKKSNNVIKNEEEEKKKLISYEIEEAEVKEDLSKHYIHVRAKRGQATDSHSLAERVRREKISEKMKMLQKLVPGCDKVTAKAVVLDKMINYIQSLQNQVEFLSMKLTSMNPMFHDFGMDLDSLMIKPEIPSTIASPIPSTVPQNNLLAQVAQPIAFADTVYSHNVTNYPFLGSSTSLFLEQAQQPNALFHDNGCLLWDVDDQRQNFHRPTGFSNN